jgi:beta-glucanase (GH16 family)
MNRKLISFSVFCVALHISACSKHFNIQKGTLQWKEDFDQTGSFDKSKWAKIPRGTSDWNKYMSDFDSCYAMRDGKLILRGIKNTRVTTDTTTYLTGGVYTKNKMSFGFGRLEIRAKLNGATGAWPAIWMLAENARWPEGGEIDIMERLNFDTIAYQTIHSHYTVNLKIKDNPRQGATGIINPAAFNTYAVEKYPDSLVSSLMIKGHLHTSEFKQIKKVNFPSISLNITYLLICNWEAVG